MKCRAAGDSPAPKGTTAASEDGVVAFRLEFRAGRLHVERTQLRADARRVTQSMRFENDSTFILWCDADRLRFTYPLLYANLKRSGCALFSATP